MSMDLDLQGNIEKFTIPEVLQLIAAGRKSGTLGIQQEDSIVMIYFDKGEIIYGYGPRQTFHLGRILKERGVLTAEQLEQAVAVQARSENSRRLGEILIDRGFIDRADLETVVREQVEELLYSLMGWQEGSFKFYEDQFPTDEEITVRLSVENVILEGLRRLDEYNMIRETLPDLDVVYTISASQGGRSRAVTMEADEWNLMALVDGYHSIDEICEHSVLGRDETLKKLARLKLAGIITATDRKKTDAADSLTQQIDHLAELFEDYLTDKRSDRQVTRRISETIVGETD